MKKIEKETYPCDLGVLIEGMEALLFEMGLECIGVCANGQCPFRTDEVNALIREYYRKKFYTRYGEFYGKFYYKYISGTNPRQYIKRYLKSAPGVAREILQKIFQLVK